MCLADDGGVAGDTLRLEIGMKTMWNPLAVEIMMGKNDENSLKVLGEAYTAAAEKISGYRSWLLRISRIP